MTIRVFRAGLAKRLICVVLAVLMASAPSANLLVQTSVAQESVGQTKVAAPAGMIDTTYVAPGAVALAVFRPSQVMKSPMSELLPVEVATAAGLKYLNIGPAN